MRGPLFNQDCTDFFYSHSADQMSAETIDAWVDGLAEAGVGVLISNVNAMRTNYASDVWESFWHGYDPAADNDQPVLRYSDNPAELRRWLDSAMRLASLGINFHVRAFARCKGHGIGCWASIRMNDLHDCHLEDSPLLSTFYKQQRAEGKVRVPYRFTSWPDRALDWARAEVRDHYLNLVREVLTFDGIEGLELDWMRFPYHFRVGHELEGGEILEDWIAQVRQLCNETAARVGHPIRLGCRVPSTPETARRLGLDGVAWARAGLIDLLVVTPFWATCEFNMPIRTWRRLLDNTQCALAGGLEVRYQPFPGGPEGMVTPELARGAATAVLSAGADFVYLFNYFADMHLGSHWTRDEYNETLRAMSSLAELERLPRRHAVTFRDTRAPGEPADDPLPAAGDICQFRLQTGPKPAGRTVEVLIELAPVAEGATPAPVVRVNGAECPSPRREGATVFIYPVPEDALTDEETVLEATQVGTRILRVEVIIR